MKIKRKCKSFLKTVFLVASVFYLCPYFLHGILSYARGSVHWGTTDIRQSLLAAREDVKTTHPAIYSRGQQVKDRCMGIISPPKQNGTLKPLIFPMQPYISYHPMLFFCPLAKAGSTFFTRYFMAIQREQMINPYEIDIASAGRSKQPSFKSLKTSMEQQKFLNKSVKAVFTRSPYSRIFSAYIDKLYSPNPVFWQGWGGRSIALNKLPKEEHPCGSQISFPHFVRVVIHVLSKIDMHFIPMDNMCKFCEVGYDVIGKVENSIGDIDFLSRKINISSSFLYEKNYKETSARDAILDSTRDPLSEWREKIATCISTYNSGQIIWRKLQIRGLIDASINFPFSEKEMEKIRLEDYRKECFKAHQNSKDKARLKLQKMVAYQQAYSALSRMAILNLQQIYKRDFLLLDYSNERPDASFSELGVSSSNSLDWETPWILT